MKTIVVGSGIIGASVAYHLAVRGVEVTVVTGNNPGGIATAASFAWINAAPGNSRPYFEFRLKAILDWHRLQHELNGSIEMNCNGSLWWEDDMESVEEKVQESVSWGYPMRIVSRTEAKVREPSLRQHPEQSAYSAIEGSVPPLRTAQLLLERAAAGGAVFHTDKVLALAVDRDRVMGVRTVSGPIKADKVILAAGEASEALSADVGVVLPMANRTGFLAYTAPRPPLLHGIILAPKLHMRQCVDGRIFAGWDFGGSEVPFDPHHEAETLIGVACELLADDDLCLEHFTLGVRPIPADGLPVIGPVSDLPGLYLAVMHSGITLAPLVGRLSAEEIVGGHALDVLEPYRLDRFTCQ
jgi:glycine/D-amino acid oxidase-like deaminating enzyme